VTDPIQELLIAARKNQILDAAAAVFSEKGFHPTTTRDIAKRAGISEGTIYNYFANKNALLLGIFERMKDSAVQDYVPEALEAPDFPTFLRMYLRPPLIALQKDNFALFRIIISETMVNEELRVLYEQQIFQATLDLDAKYFQEQAAKYGFTLPNPRLTARFIATMMLGLIMEHILDNRKPDEQLDELVTYVADLIACTSERNPK
jgi:AcrR family transcriptional regulator